MPLLMPDGYPASTPSVGVQATSPNTNVTPPTNTLTSTQTAPKDLSGTYANVGGTIYNTQSQTKFANPADFFKDSGVNSFDNLKFNTAYSPTGKETIYGQQPAPAPSSGANLAPNTLSTPPPTPGAYTPPNQGTTGVSQGGIIGNLIGQSQQQNPNYTNALNKVNDISSQQAALADEAAKKNNDILSRPTFLTESNGQQGVLAQLLASKQAALAPEYNAAIAELQGANTQSSNQIQAGSSAGSLNAPIVNPQTQGLVTPSSNSTTGQTTSGASNIGSLVGSRSNADVYGIGTRIGADGHTTEYFNKADPSHGFATPQALADFINSKNPNAAATAANVFNMLGQQQYYNTQTNQGFSDPQALANFVNQQQGNQNANAGNVFDQLNQGQSGDVVKQTDPYYQTLQTAAGFLKSNNVDAANKLMANMPAAVQAQVYRMAGQGYDPNTSAAQGHSVQDLTGQVSAIKAVLPAADANFQLALNIAKQAGINNNDASVLNELQNKVNSKLADPSALASFKEALQTVRSLYAQILGGSSNPTVDSQQTANSTIPDNISLGALTSLAQTMMSSANNRITAIQNQINSLSGGGNTSGGGAGGDPLGLGI